jgi:hypothetical protein
MTTRGNSRLARRFESLIEERRSQQPRVDALERAVRELQDHLNEMEERTIRRRFARAWLRLVGKVKP